MKSINASIYRSKEIRCPISLILKSFKKDFAYFYTKQKWKPQLVKKSTKCRSEIWWCHFLHVGVSLNFYLVYFIFSIAAYSVVKVTYNQKEILLWNSRSSRKVLRTLVCVVSVFPISLQYLQPSSAISRKRKQLLFLIKTT